MKVQEAIKSDGSVLRVGDEVEAYFLAGNGRQVFYHKNCEGVIFVIASIEHLVGYSKTGFLVVAHVKEHPDRSILGFKKEDFVFPDGIDADWFTKIKKD